MSDLRTDLAPSGRSIPARPSLGLAEIVIGLWRSKFLMALVFMVIFSPGLFLAMQMPTTYTASSRLLATLDDFYVYRPLAGGDAAGIALEQDQVIQAEIELLRSPVVTGRVLDEIGLATLYPKLAQARDEALQQARHPARQIEEEARETAIDTVLEHFGVYAAPERPVISTSFTHEDPRLSAAVLNAIMDAYLDYRTALFSGGAGENFASQRIAFEAELSGINTRLALFMTEHGVTDLEAELAGLQRLAEAVQSDLLASRARRQAVEGQLEVVAVELRTTPRDSDIYVEDNSSQTLISLKLEREDLLARYTDDAEPVRAINARIAQIEAFLASQGELAGTVRRGPNPVYQALETSRATLEAETRALEGQERELTRQIADLSRRQSVLSGLAPEWRELQRTRALVEANVIDYSTREAQARTRSELSRGDGDNIRVLEPARVPVEGSSMKMIVALAALMMAGLSALMAGLIRVVTRRGFSTSQSLERTTGIPVLASLGPSR